MKSNIALLALGIALPIAAQTPDPSASYRTVTTEHFYITYSPQLNHLVTPAAERAEEAYAQLTAQLVRPPKGRIDLLLADNSDITNGFAARVPSNRIVIFVKPPVAELDIQQFRDWLDLVITHELAHVFHLDLAGAVGRGLRAIFGRAPLAWPFFPAAATPRWSIEGLAVDFESRGTGSARIHGSFSEMVVRTAVLEAQLDPIDRVSGDTPIWPGGQRAYIYGGLFMDYLSRKHGGAVQGELARKTAASVLPPTFVFNLIGKRAIGRALTDEYAAWENQLRFRYRALGDSLRASGLTATTRLTMSGRSALYPRISPDGRTLSFAEENGRDMMRTRIVDIENGRTLTHIRRNSSGPADWLRDGSLITAQLDFTDRYSIHSDLYRFAGRGQDRLTRRARIEEPDANSAGDRIVAVENGEGASRLVMLDGRGNVLRAITDLSFGIGWSLPRWSPDGTRIAAGRWSRGGAYDIVVIDTTGTVLLRVTEDEAIDAAPAWSPDGRYIVFWSDRTGIPNLFAFDTERRTLFQVTNLVTGAFHPDVSPDGRYIVFAAYHAVGYYIERIRYDPSSWRPAAPGVVLASRDRPRASLDQDADHQVQSAVSEPRAYGPWRTLRPRYWIPFIQREDAAGEFYGLATSGVDLVGRHAYGLTIGYNVEDGRTIGFGTYVYSGFGNPTLQATFERDWDDLGRVRVAINNGVDTVSVDRIEREDVGALGFTLQRRRFRTSTSLTLGGEIVDRRRMVPGTAGVRFIDDRDRLYGGTARVIFANYRFPALAISREDGLFLQVGGRWRFEPDTVQRDRGYREFTTWNTLYRSLPLPGFAHHVLAARFSAALRDGAGASLLEVGGIPGGAYDIGLTTIGLGGSFLPVRGFEEGDQAGTRAWSASVEYRMPLVQLGRGYKLWPVFLDRMHLSAFGDAGKATCDATARSTFLICENQSTDLLTSVGGEVGADVSVVSFFTTRLRIGVAQPLSGPRTTPIVYATFGPSF